jgi:peptide-methionine (S)-S-oxide reductase
VYITRVGYTGGKKEWPTYSSIGDHTEVSQIRFDFFFFFSIFSIFLFFSSDISPFSFVGQSVSVDFDPSKVTYQQLLDLFWREHNPQCRSSRQYRSAIFYYNDEQKELAISSKNAAEAKHGRTLFTDIEPAGDFYLGEDYHQKFRLRNVGGILEALKLSTVQEVANSPIATK